MGTKYCPNEDPKLVEGLTESVTRSLIENNWEQLESF